jgi:hypothetical protein
VWRRRCGACACTCAIQQDERAFRVYWGGVGVAGSYEELIAAGRQRILDTFEQHGLGDIPILDEFVIAPPAWEARYGLKHGAAFGLAHGLNQLSIMRWVAVATCAGRLRAGWAGLG